MVLRTALFGLLFISSTFGAVVPSTHQLHEKRDTLHPRWERVRRVAPDSTLPVRIALTQSINLDSAGDHLLAVSDPASPNFAKYWTSEQVIEAFQPSEPSVAAVRNWLITSGIDEARITHSDNKAWLAFDATTTEMESLLHAEYHEYKDQVTGGRFPSCEEYHLPAHLREHIEFVHPTTRLMAPIGSRRYNVAGKPSIHGGKLPSRVSGSNPANLSICDEEVSPACIAALYHIPPTDLKERPVKGNEMGIFESETEYYAQENMDLFFEKWTPYIPQGTGPTFISVDGGPGPVKNVSNAGYESDLDFQVAFPLIYPQNIAQYQVGDKYYEGQRGIAYTFGFNNFLDAIDGSYCTYSADGITGDSSIDPSYPDPRPDGYKGQLQCGVYKPTNVISISYGGQEADYPANYQKRQCNEYLKLGLQGVSIFFASGDSGVGFTPAQFGGDDNPITGCLGPDGLLFNPTWPNNCPWITNVGMTGVAPGNTVYDPEIAPYIPAGPYSYTNFSSGGGFSNIYPIPDYQKSALSHYFDKHLPPYKSYSKLVDNSSEIASLGKDGGLYNRIGRGIPDVSANGFHIATVDDGYSSYGSGTSASSPLFAALINRVNEERLKAGKKTVGFVNPTLYAHPEIFNDITNGTNPGCETPGFSAVEGWDPVTGLGTPNFPKLLELYMSLP